MVGFLNWTRGPGTSDKLAIPCQPGRFRPHASYLRKEARCRAAAKKLLLLRLPRNITQGSADPCAIPVVLVKQCLPCEHLLRFLPALSFWIAAAIWYAMHSTIRLPSSKPDSLSPPQGIFALQKSLRGDCGGDGVPTAVGNSSPRAKKFPEEICFAPSRVLQICRTPRLAVAQKYVTTPDWSHVRVGQPQGARGTTVPLFREASRGTPSKGFLWATSS